MTGLPADMIESARIEAEDERLLLEISEFLDLLIADAISARREIRLGDRESLRAALATLRLLTGELVLRWESLSAPESGA